MHAATENACQVIGIFHKVGGNDLLSLLSNILEGVGEKYTLLLPQPKDCAPRLTLVGLWDSCDLGIKLISCWHE